MVIRKLIEMVSIIRVLRMTMLCLTFLSFACSEEGTVPKSEHCALPEMSAAGGDKLLVTAVESEGQLKLTLFPDRCSKALRNVYFKPHALQEIEHAFREIPGRKFDGVKIAILDGSVISKEVTTASGAREVILVDDVHSVYAMTDSNFD